MVNQYDFMNIEGPVWVGDSLYYSEVKATDSSARIFKLTGESSSVFIENSGSNGMAVDKDGNLVTANQGVGGIVRSALPSKTRTTLVGTYDNKRFNCPNDLVYRSDGTLYFTDPDFQNTARPQGATRTYQLPPNATTATVIATDYGNNPNGVTLSLDEKTLFVGGPGGVKQYAIDASGKVADMGSAFGTALSSNSDGMTLDCAGNLYVAVPNTNTIVVVDKTGQPVANSPLKVNGTNAVTNVAFGGEDRKTLYITSQGQGGSQGVYKVKLNFPGRPY